MRHAEQVVVMSASPATIDRDGLHRTNLRLMARALAAIGPAPTPAWWTVSGSGPRPPSTGRSLVGTAAAPPSPPRR